MLLTENDLKMLQEDPKDFFNQKLAIIRLIDADYARIDKYRTCAFSTAAKPSEGGGFTVGNAVSKTEICVVKIDEIERHIAERKQELASFDCKLIFVADNFIENKFNRAIMLYRFLDLRPWKNIEHITGLSKRALLKRQENFLKEIAEKACTFTSKHGKI